MKTRLFFAALAFSASFAIVGCKPGEGDRCLPDPTDDECGGGTSCQAAPGCKIYVCCPAVLTASSPAACSVCPVDTGEDTGADETSSQEDTGVDQDTGTATDGGSDTGFTPNQDSGVATDSGSTDSASSQDTGGSTDASDADANDAAPVDASDAD